MKQQIRSLVPRNTYRMVTALGTFLFIWTVFLSSTVSAGDQGDYDVCVSVRQRDSPRVNNINSTAQVNRPGKMGPRGPRGFKGDVGPPGECVCDQQRLDEMQSEMDRLKDFYRELKVSLTLLNSKENPEACYVGLKNRQIPDSALTASMVYDPTHGPRFARLDNPINPGVWVAGRGNAQVGQWIQVDLGSSTTITGIVTQGRRLFDQWITSFRISYGNSTTSQQLVKNAQGTDKIFVGNHDRESYKVNLFIPAITARYFRLYVVSFNSYASLRMEFLKC